MLSRPQHGWTVFSLGENRYSLSYLTNIPFEWLDRAVFGLESLLPFDVHGYCEPGSMVCTVSFWECRVTFKDDSPSRSEPLSEVLPVSMLDFCKQLHNDISVHIDAWEQWNPSYKTTKADLLSKLDRLKKLIDIKANCFI